MIDLQSVTKMYSPDLLVVKQKVAKEIIKTKYVNLAPKSKTLDLVISAIKTISNVNRVGILKKTNLSGHVVDKSIRYLLKNNIINRIQTGLRGGYKAYSYHLIK